MTGRTAWKNRVFYMQADVKLRQREEQVPSKDTVDAAFPGSSFAFAYFEAEEAPFLRQTHLANTDGKP